MTGAIGKTLRKSHGAPAFSLLQPWYTRHSTLAMAVKSEVRERDMVLHGTELFRIVARRERKALEPWLQTPWIGKVRRNPQTDEVYVLSSDTRSVANGVEEDADLLGFACRQRGLVHRIVGRLLASQHFIACSSANVVVRTEHRRRALAAARSVRNRKTIAVLLEAWPELGDTE